MKRVEPLRLGEVIDQMIKATGLRPQMDRCNVESMWPRIAGKHIAAYTRRVQLDGRMLHVWLTSAALKEELGYIRELLAEQINKAAGSDAVDNIIIH
ncbi:MAG: DUF721 domain-containing protein [Muribaculaceae bacterium]|nr:DUF721 domain-containing protein [Muribaculaceae bacterium]